MALQTALLYVLLFVLSTKVLAYVIGFGRMMRLGTGALPPAIQELGLENHYPGEYNPIDGLIAGLKAPLPFRVLARAIFNAPILVTLGFAACALSTANTGHFALRYVGVGTAGVTVLAFMAAVLRRLVLGRDDWRTSDVALPRWGPFKRWAVVNDADDVGANRLIYFIVLLYMGLVGFAALYQALDLTNPRLFQVEGARGWTTWIYFSATTLATVGYGDIHARSAGAQIAVTSQIITGPMLIAWLVAVLLTPGLPPRFTEPTMRDDEEQQQPPG